MTPLRAATTLAAAIAMVLSGADPAVLTAAVVCVLCVYYTAVAAYGYWYAERRTWTDTDQARYEEDWAYHCAARSAERSDREAAQIEEIRRVLGEER